MQVCGEWNEAAFGQDGATVDVLRVRLDMPQSALAAMRATLSDEEAHRAGQFRFDADRDRYVAARGALRQILGCCAQVHPADVHLALGEHGKPELGAEHSRIDLHFNLAHSGDRALMALSSASEVGVDLERVRDDLDHQAIAERFLGPAHALALRKVPQAERPECFTLAWTRTEACAKASGLGLGLALAQADERDWEVVTLRPWDGYVGAVASRERGWSARVWDWSPE